VTEVGRKGTLCNSIFTILINAGSVYCAIKKNAHGVIFDDE
jgi:hypothetical protein